MNEQGAGAAAYAVLREFPLSGLFIFVYIVAVFISFITATDSTTNAMASISTTGMDDGTKEAPLVIKIMWGAVITVVTLVFLTTLGIDGIRMMSYLGGFPALFIGALSLISLVLIMRNHKEMDKSEGGSDEEKSSREEVS
jgi:choline-glycine betaine transporter